MTPTPPRRPRLLTILQVADELQISTKTVRRWIAVGQLATHRLGRQLRIAEADLVVFMAQNRMQVSNDR